MKKRSIWVVTLVVVLLLMVAASCVPAATPIPTPAPGTAPATPSSPTSANTDESMPPIPPMSMQRQRTSGTISKIDGKSLTLITAQGLMTVKISDNITIQNVTTGTIADLRVGSYLMAIGPQDANGNLAATSIVVRSQVLGAPPTPSDGAYPANPRSPRAGARRGASGTLTKIDGSILSLTTTQGAMTVNISSENTTIQNFKTGTLADLHEGELLNVMGPQDANGNVTATYIIHSTAGPGRSTNPTPWIMTKLKAVITGNETIYTDAGSALFRLFRSLGRLPLIVHVVA